MSGKAKIQLVGFTSAGVVILVLFILFRPPKIPACEELDALLGDNRFEKEKVLNVLVDSGGVKQGNQNPYNLPLETQFQLRVEALWRLLDLQEKAANQAFQKSFEQGELFTLLDHPEVISVEKKTKMIEIYGTGTREPTRIDEVVSGSEPYWRAIIYRFDHKGHLNRIEPKEMK